MSEQEMKQKKAGRGSLAPVRPRRDYKDTLFRMLFNDREALLSLYNAVGNTDYRDSSLLQIVTLENAVYMNVKNDLAFLLGFELNLYEHQSTWNPNMPLRDLFYAAREYEMLIRDQSLYSSRLIKLPVPRFIVFYNGREKQEERCVLKLSDAFETPVEECIQEGILRDFLLKYRAEVTNVSIFEYNEEREKELLRKAEYESGRKEGMEQGMEQGICALIQTCRELGASRETVSSALIRRFSISGEEAEGYLERFWE